ncbi:Rv2231c family pyridoxal phosphate-dependent protein CobC [Nocardioides sp.]|uniref:Rv2231c family pyridoxal phosphate-dependent protein CobC n=1 Tax=Nocardioides sp. TaxID=35761 RepID=UPI003516A8F0
MSTTATSATIADPLRHHGDTEARAATLDLAVNVIDDADLPRPRWLDDALRASLDHLAAYPDPTRARAAAAAHHGRPVAEVLLTAGAAEAFTLVARMRAWRRPAVIHPQFTEPHAALEAAGHRVTTVLLRPPFTLGAGAAVPEDADLVVVGNPTNPTGVLHARADLLALRRPGRLLVVDEAFMDAVPGEPASLADTPAGLLHDLDPGGDVVVLRSLTKHWGIPGVRAGYLVGSAGVVHELGRVQTPWSVATTAAAAVEACCTPTARAEAHRRAVIVEERRAHLERGLADLGVPAHPSCASFVLARPGRGVHARLRQQGVAVRRADTFPGLDDSWIRIAVRSPEVTDRFLVALRAALAAP